MMTSQIDHIQLLKLAEQQFRLACIVAMHATLETLPLDAPVEQTYGDHRTTWDEFGLRQEQVEYAAPALQFVSTFVMSSAMRQAFADHVPNAKEHKNPDVVAAYQIARMTRNAFAHHMLMPIWSIDGDCRNKVFSVPGVIKLDTTNLNGIPFKWESYGGHLAIWRLSQWVRFNVLGDTPPEARVLPNPPTIRVWKQGPLTLRKIGENPQEQS
jgi:hypothetical protein